MEMIDIEKIIKGLQCIVDGTVRCESCGYAIDKHGHYSCQQECAKDAIALLKEQEARILTTQEAKRPVVREKNGYWDYVCPTCGSRDEELFREWNYCAFCGQTVKWE